VFGLGQYGKKTIFFPQLMVLRESIGISGVSPTTGAYERVGLILTNKYGESGDVNEIKR
jgi:hypothetical protein